MPTRKLNSIRKLRERFRADLPVLCLHSDRGGEFSSDLLRDFCRGEGILQSFTLLDSPQQNGIAERRIGSDIEVTRTSMIHAAAPHFLWSFTVRYAVHQLNLWPRVSLPETSPTLCWTGKVGDASVFWVWGSRAFVRDTSADKLSAHAIPCVFLGFSPDAPGWQFYHPTLRRIFPSQDVTFDEPGPAPSGVSQVDPLPSTAPVQVAVGSGAARGAGSGGAASGGAALEGAEFEGAGSGGAEPGGAEPAGAEPGGAEPPGGAESEGAESRGAEPRGTTSSGGPAGASPHPAAGDTGAGGAGVTARAGGTGGAAAAGPGGPRTKELELETLRSLELLGLEVLELEELELVALALKALAREALDLEELELLTLPASPLPTPSPYTEKAGGLTERREPASHTASPVRTGRGVPRPCPRPNPGTHVMALRPSSVPLRVPLLPPPKSSLPAVPDPESDRARAASPTVSRLLDTVVTDPSFESTAAFALVAELLDFASDCRLDYATALATESESASLPSVGGECALGTDVLEDRQEDFECLAAAVPRFASMLLALEGDPDAPDIPTPRSYAEAITGPYSSQWQAAMDAEMASWKSTCTYVDEVPALGANIVDGMWIFRGADYFQTFSPTPKMTTLRVLLHVAAQRDYELHSLDFSTAFLQGSLHKEIWLRRPPSFTLSSTLSSSVLSSSCEAEIYAGAMAAQELHGFTYLLTDLGEQPRSPPVLYVALCEEHILEHRTKHIALRYFLARDMQQRGQLHLAYVASRANTADIFTKALLPDNHQHFSSMLGLVPTLPHLLTA
ncbi:unnamed protein product [Closterium sp. NIES-53]